jgi:chemotaxis protein CheD
MGQIVVGIGEYKISADQSDIIKTYALGSCVAVIIYDKIKNIAGMIHIALPESSVDTEKAKKMPGHFADTGIPMFIEDLKKRGVLKANIWIKLAGGANVMDPDLIFDIGKRNALAIKKVLWRNNLGPVAEDIGGNYSRTVSVQVSSGEITVSSGPDSWSL